LEEAWNNLYAGYIEGVPSTLVLNLYSRTSKRLSVVVVLMDLKHQICPSTLVKNGDKQTPTRDRMLILIISMSFGKLLFIGDRLYIWGENRAQTKKKVHFRAFYMSMRIEGPIS